MGPPPNMKTFSVRDLRLLIAIEVVSLVGIWIFKQLGIGQTSEFQTQIHCALPRSCELVQDLLLNVRTPSRGWTRGPSCFSFIIPSIHHSACGPSSLCLVQHNFRLHHIDFFVKTEFKGEGHHVHNPLANSLPLNRFTLLSLNI